MLLQLLEKIESAPAGHGDIEQDKIPFLLPDQIEPLLGRIRLADPDLGKRTHQDLSQPAAHNGMIIGYQNLHRIPPSPTGSTPGQSFPLPAGPGS